ncbi:hypothetical protein LAZ67_1004169 [Cordylochernes scorpioides]|uniref:Reverse transcriptase domain-containing protein n=1 Tax=Cordylochernes scorpioides TaxID=51811 RepID=A0ABY6JYT6_9ARAC|nr:hypothetical protein LAZ67_1004169 [Cordylochernes scorpioides]
MRAWFYRECKKAKRRDFRMLSGSFVNDPWGSLHKFIKKGSQNPNPLSSTSFEKNLLSHSVPKYLNSILNTFFFNPPPDTRPAHFHYSTPRHLPKSHPDPPFTSVELRIAYSSLKPRKAPGPDHIPGKFDKWMISSFHDFFLLQYNSCLTLGHFPTAWKIGRLALVPKPHSDGDFTSSHRPITLLSAFSKIFESLLCHRLSHLLENNNLLHPLQLGFRRGKSPTDALFNLKTQISDAKTRLQCCLLINLDIKSAFDHLWHPVLISRLSNIGLSPSFISIFSSFLNNRQVTLEYRGFSCTTSPKRGCAQGSKSGPILWNIFFDPILSLPFPPGVHAQAFADGLQLIIHGDPNNLKNIAQISINLIIEWCLDNKLTLSPSKSSILPIFCSEPTIHIQNSTIPCVKDITILGVNFNSRFSFSPHLNNICEKILKLFPRLRSCANSYFGFGYRAIKLFYHSVIEPTLTYAAPIWAEAADTTAGRSRLRSTQRKFCINAIHGFRTVPTLTSFALLRVLPIDHKLKLLSSLYNPSHSLPFKAEHPPIPYSYPQPHLLLDLSHSLIPESTPDISYYTDGSKTSSGVGSGIFRSSSIPSIPCLESSLSLSKHCTVFQTESFALLTALKDIRTVDQNLSIGIFFRLPIPLMLPFKAQMLTPHCPQMSDTIIRPTSHTQNNTPLGKGTLWHRGQLPSRCSSKDRGSYKSH